MKSPTSLLRQRKTAFQFASMESGRSAASVKPVYTIVTADTKPAVLISIEPPAGEQYRASRARGPRLKWRRSCHSIPHGVHLRPFYDQSTIVTEAIKSVRDAILIGLILASIILVVFLRDWGTSLVAGMVIPVTVLVTFIALKVLGESFNLMTLGGLAAAVGLVIDDAIVVVENIVLHRASGEGRVEAIHQAMKEITVPLVGSTVTPVVVFLPLISITGVTGTFFRALAVTMGVSLFTSLGLALAWTPNLALHFLRRKESDSRPLRRQMLRQPAQGLPDSGGQGGNAAPDGGGRGFDDRFLRQSHSFLRTLVAPRPRSSPVVGRNMRRAHCRLLHLLSESGNGPVAGHGRGRICSGLRDATWELSRGNGPHGFAHRADLPRGSGGGKHVAAHWPAAWTGGGDGSQHRRYLRQAQEKARRSVEEIISEVRAKVKKEDPRWTWNSSRCSRT